MLTATLPFGGVTLIEYQARLLIGAGASQIVVMVARLTPELLGAINRIGRRDVTVDTVRSAAEAAEKFHPLARVLMLADGLTTTPDVVAAMAHEGGDALLVVGEDERDGAFERVGGGMAWAGIARLDPRRIAELAALPRDYDMESTLVRLASQARATHVELPAGALTRGHGIDHGGAIIAERGRSVLRDALSAGSTWFDRLVIAPLARVLVPVAVRRAIPVVMIGLGGVALGLGGLIALWWGKPALGTVTALIGAIVFALTARLAMLRDERAQEGALEAAALALPMLAILVDGHAMMLAQANGGPQIVAVATVTASALAERAATAIERPWWGANPACCLAVAAIGALVGSPVAGLALAALVATATLAGEIELLRRQA
ncbi:hypothetical protein [Sphingomonas oligophenolica]|nr:hypothetical protein [Sphingomonas oligophenolica]